MNIYDYIITDHRNVAELFKQFDKTPSSDQKKAIVDTICKELFVHLEAEQETFYKVLQRHPTCRNEAMHGHEEHDEIEQQLELVLSSTDWGTAWEKRVHKLQEIVDHHVKEEESMIHSEARKVLTPQDAIALKEKMHNYKQKLLNTINKRLSKSQTQQGKKTG